jgi:hypothetical protein
VLKSLVPTQSSQDKEKFTCPFQSTDNFPEWKLAFTGERGGGGAKPRLEPKSKVLTTQGKNRVQSERRTN